MCVLRGKWQLFYALAYFSFIFILQDAFAHFKNFYSSFLVVALYELDVNLTFFLAKFLEKKRVLDVSFISSEVSLIWHLLCIFQTHVYFILGSNWSNKSSISLLRLFDGGLLPNQWLVTWSVTRLILVQQYGSFFICVPFSGSPWQSFQQSKERSYYHRLVTFLLEFEYPLNQ